MKKIKAIFFDLDGTLVDTDKYYWLGTYDWMKELGFKGKEEDILPIIGKDMNETYAYLKTLLPQYSIEDFKKANDHYFLYENPIDYPNILFEGTKEGLKKLKDKGYILAICSMNYVPEIERIAKLCGLDELFDGYFSGEDCPHNKPAPDIYLAALNYFGLNKDEAVVIEDSYSGIKAGKSSGILTIARKEERFKVHQEEADYTIRNLDELDKYLKEL